MTDDLLEEQTFAVPEGYEVMNWNRGFGRQIGPLYQWEKNGAYRRAFLVEEYHTNGMGNCHGGMLMAFADMAFGHAATIRFNRYWVTVRLVTDFVSAARLGDWVEGTGEITGLDGDILAVKGQVWTGERTILAGTGIFKVLGERPPR